MKKIVIIISLLVFSFELDAQVSLKGIELGKENYDQRSSWTTVAEHTGSLTMERTDDKRVYQVKFYTESDYPENKGLKKDFKTSVEANYKIKLENITEEESKLGDPMGSGYIQYVGEAFNNGCRFELRLWGNQYISFYITDIELFNVYISEQKAQISTDF